VTLEFLTSNYKSIDEYCVKISLVYEGNSPPGPRTKEGGDDPMLAPYPKCWVYIIADIRVW
jgi:hypothetical protein